MDISILGTTGKALEKLQIAIHRSTIAFPSSCASLPELNLSSCSNNNLNLDISSIHWDTVGSRLGNPIFAGVSVSDDGLGRIREHCSNLKHIDMGIQEIGNIAGFMASYGDQLEFVSVEHMPENELNVVAESRRNVRFHAQVFLDNSMVSAIKLLIAGDFMLLFRRCG